MTLFDRYLLKRFWHVFCIGFAGLYGLFVIFDAFENADEFQGKASGSVSVMLSRMAVHYFFQAFPFLDLLSPTLAVISVIAVFSILQRLREIYPVLSAGVPTYRLAVPVLVGVMSIVLLMTINQELIMPNIADRLQANRGTEKAIIQRVETARDFVTDLEISGDKLDLREGAIENAQFVLPVPTMVSQPSILKAERAVYFPARGDRPAGWRLKQATPAYEKLALTDRGATIVYGITNSSDIFVATAVTIDQLHNRSGSFRYLSTAELVNRIRNPAFGAMSIRSQTLNLHERLTRPFAILLAAIVAIPLTMKRESRGLLENIAVCCGVLGLMFLLSQASLQLGRLNVLPMALAAWLPLVLTGGLSAWVSHRVQT